LMDDTYRLVLNARRAGHQTPALTQRRKEEKP
jgi:hypothetical protein